MADPLITVEQLEDRLGYELEDAELAQAQAFLADASALVRQIAGEELTTVPDAIVPVVVGMVRRAIDNPHGYSSLTDGNYTWQGPHTSGIFATRDEEKAIRRAVGKLGMVEANLSNYLPLAPSTFEDETLAGLHDDLGIDP